MAFITVTGEVTRTFYNGRGAEITESFQAGGKDIKKRWACWFENEHGLAEGQTVEVSGIHSDQVDSWEKDGETKYTVKRSINKTKVKGDKATQGQQTAQQPASEPWAASAPPAAAQGDTWNTAPDEGLPF
jgi:hypothetical protein